MYMYDIRAIDCDFAKDLYKSLRNRVEERRTVYSPLLNFLKNPYKKSDLDTDSIKSELKALILRFVKGPEKEVI